MKKLLSIVLVLALVLASATVAFAAPEVITNADMEDGNETKTHDVTIKINPSTGGGNVYMVDVEWGDLTFEYSRAKSATWNPESHTNSGGTTAGWVDGKTSADIVVTNHSNATVGVDAYFYNGGSATKNQDNNGVKVNITGGTANLVADPTTGINGTQDTCPKCTFNVAVDTGTTPADGMGTFVYDTVVVVITK